MKQQWDNEKGGVVGEDDECIISTSGEDSWWDDDDGDTKKRVSIEGTKKFAIDAKKSVSRQVPDAGDNDTLL